MTYTIKEASDITGIPATTLRYYDKEGILPFLERKESGHKMFSEQDLSMLRIIECLKCTGMSIKDIRHYAVWAQMGDSTLEQRYNLFLERREAVMAQIKELEDQLKVIDYKCKYYEEAIAAGTATPETADGEETAVPETVEVQSKKNDTVHTYLKDNTTPIYWDYPLEDADFGNADYRVFLAGETRGQPQNTAMRKALFQYLHEQQGVNVQLVETGVGETQVLEQYLRTGDENWLNHYLKLQGSCADAEAEYWRWLYQYNRQQGGTIHVAGLGTERNTVVSMYGLLALADTEIEPAESIADFVQALRDEDMTTALQLFKTAMEEQPDAMADYFGDAYAQVQQLYANLQVNTTYKGRLDRDDLPMMDNMNFVLRQYPDDKFFGQLSNGHVTQSAWKDGNYIANYSRFGMLLNGEGSPVQGEVCSMLTIYTQRGSNGLLGDDAENDYYDLTALAEAAGKEFIATGADLFLALDNEDTPYTEQNGLIKPEVQAEEKPLMDYCQKLIVLFDTEN